MIDNTYRLIDVRIIDGTGSAPLEDAEVTIVNGRFEYVGLRRSISTGLPTFSLSGRTLLPGFIDCHVHALLDVEEDAATVLADRGSHAVLKAAQRLRQTLDAGVTTVRDLGGMDDGIRRGLAKGLIAGPQARIAVGAISPTGGHVDQCLPNDESHPGICPSALRVADSDDEVIKAVRTLLRQGADVIKLCSTGGVSSPSDQPDDLGVGEHQVRLIRNELDRHSRPRRIAAHAQGARGILEAVRGGVDSIEHGYDISDEAIELMLDRGTYLVPTLSSALRVPDPAHVPHYLYEKKVRWSARARERIAVAIAAGVRIAMGTDAGVCPHGRNLLELAHMVDLGMSPLQAIVAGTSSAAALLGMEETLGAIRPGLRADLVATRHDPLADVRALADPCAIDAVVQAGVPVKDPGNLLDARSVLVETLT